MKKSFAVFFVLLMNISTIGFSQTLFLPTGTSSIGTTTTPSNGRNGFGTNAPGFFLDVSTTAGNAWLMHATNTTNNSHVYFAHGSGYGLLVDAGTNQSASKYSFKVYKNGVTNPYFQVMGDGSSIINSTSATYNTRLSIKSGWGNWLAFQNESSTGYWAFHNGVDQNAFELYHTNSSGVSTFALMHFNDNGQLGIGTSCIPSDGQMAVEGKLYAREVEVNANSWCDYVFDNNYQLMPLYELKNYIVDNKHLPGVPTTQEVMNEGINLGDMDAILLKKVEELTLYILELEKQISELQNQVSKQ